MRVSVNGKYLKVLDQGEGIRKDLLLGWRQKKGDPWIVAENNIVNRIVIGQPVNRQMSHYPIQNADGLMPFQIADLDKMLGLQHFLNANPMGLGKTVETIRFLQERKARNALIVCPKIIRYQWQNQLKKWAGFEAEIYERQSHIPDDGRMWIVNYDKLRNEKTRL